MPAENDSLEAALPQPPVRKLTPWEAIRKRPGMYIGSTDEQGLYQMVYEILNNSVEEVSAGRGDRVEVVIQPNNTIMVRDNGPGIPIEIPPGEQKAALELVMTDLEASKRLNLGQHKLVVRWGGMTTTVNTLAEWARVEVCRDGQRYAQEYRQGIPTGPVARLDGVPTGWNTTTIFRPDPTIFTTPAEYDYDVLDQRARELCYLTRGLTITVRDERPGQEREVTHCFPQGILTWVRLMNLEHLKQHYAPMYEPFYVEATTGTTHIEVALQYNTQYILWSTERVLTFANNDNMVAGGTHLTGFYAGLLEAITTYAHTHNLLPGDVDKLALADVCEGLTAIISVKLPNPVCHRSFWISLDNPEVHDQVKDVVNIGLNQFFDEHPEDTGKIIKECARSAHVRVDQRRKDARAARRKRHQGRRG